MRNENTRMSRLRVGERRPSEVQAGSPGKSGQSGFREHFLGADSTVGDCPDSLIGIPQGRAIVTWLTVPEVGRTDAASSNLESAHFWAMQLSGLRKW